MNNHRFESHEGKIDGKCFMCVQNYRDLFIVRQKSSMKMIRICEDCIVNRCEEYLLDNTMPWRGIESRS
jgi:hypothetical protein